MKFFTAFISMVLMSNIFIDPVNAQIIDTADFLCPMAHKDVSLNPFPSEQMSTLKRRIIMPSLQEKIMFIYNQQMENQKEFHRDTRHTRHF